MNATTTMTIRVPTDIRDKLERLAHGTRRSRSFLAAEAVAAYVDRELSIIDGIQQGLGDIAAGHRVSHDAAMDELDAVVARVKAAKA